MQQQNLFDDKCISELELSWFVNGIPDVRKVPTLSVNDINDKTYYVKSERYFAKKSYFNDKERHDMVFYLINGDQAVIFKLVGKTISNIINDTEQIRLKLYDVIDLHFLERNMEKGQHGETYLSRARLNYKLKDLLNRMTIPYDMDLLFYELIHSPFINFSQGRFQRWNLAGLTIRQMLEIINSEMNYSLPSNLFKYVNLLDNNINLYGLFYGVNNYQANNSFDYYNKEIKTLDNLNLNRRLKWIKPISMT